MVETYPDASPLMEIMENTDNLTEELSEALIGRLEEEVKWFLPILPILKSRLACLGISFNFPLSYSFG